MGSKMSTWSNVKTLVIGAAAIWIVYEWSADDTPSISGSSVAAETAEEKKQREWNERAARAAERSRERNAERVAALAEEASVETAPLREDLRQEQITKELARKLARERGDPEPGSCRDKLDCWGEQNQFRAASLCAPLVERHAKYSHEWTDGWLGAKFTHYRWADKKTGIVTHIGDSIRFQNGFGAWSNMVYECDFDPATSRVLDVRVRAGRL